MCKDKRNHERLLILPSRGRRKPSPSRSLQNENANIRENELTDMSFTSSTHTKAPLLFFIKKKMLLFAAFTFLAQCISRFGMIHSFFYPIVYQSILFYEEFVPLQLRSPQCGRASREPASRFHKRIQLRSTEQHYSELRLRYSSAAE